MFYLNFFPKSVKQSKLIIKVIVKFYLKWEDVRVDQQIRIKKLIFFLKSTIDLQVYALTRIAMRFLSNS